MNIKCLNRMISTLLVDKPYLYEMFRPLSKKDIVKKKIYYFYLRKLVKVYCSCTDLEDATRPLFFCLHLKSLSKHGLE